jgi:lipid II:glycine glycyltransferase (peptidoglycan interpeptide bridge formation enzyme)
MEKDMIDVTSKAMNALLPTDILFQTSFWAQVKARLGLHPRAFDIQAAGPDKDVLVLLKPFGKHTIAIVPQGPEFAPPEEDYGTFIEDFSMALAKTLGPGVAFIRYDLPWISPYAGEMQQGGWDGFPEPRLRELRMNMGTRHWNIKKAPEDMTVASSLVVDLVGSEDAMLKRMKPKTRYNIRVALRKGVTVQEGSVQDLPEFYALYQQTALRNGFKSCGLKHFTTMFQCLVCAPGHSELLFLLAKHGSDLLAGAIVGIAGETANFLYGASANIKRDLMAPSLMHWTGMLQAHARGCARYEMGAVSPSDDPSHPFYGLYRFKTGFGGRIEYRTGSWDYPLIPAAYRELCNAESVYAAYAHSDSDQQQ